MIFQDNVIKEYLKNVYFITGTPCGGKTTISRELGKRYNLLVYDIDEQFEKHQKISNPAFQPSMNKAFNDADEFFGRTVEEYKKWLIDNTREQLDFVLLDLIRLSQNQIVLCDCHLTVEEADKLTEASRIVFLIKEPSDLVDDYCNRPDHQAFSDFINSTSDIEKAKAICNATLKSLNEKRCNDIKCSNYFWIERTENSTVNETVRKVEQHFGLVGKDFSMDTFEIRYMQMDDKDFWYCLDKHLPETEFENKVRDRRGYILLENRKPIGLLRYNLFWDNTPFCTMLFIDWNYHNKGYGKMLMEYWEKDMKSQGYGMLLTSTQVDEDAQHFYRKLGYKDCGGFVIDIPGYEQPMEMFLVKGI